MRFNPFKRKYFFVPPLQQKNFENIVTKGEIVHNEQVPLLRQRVSIKNSLSILDIFKIFSKMFSNSSAVDSFYLWNG